MNPIYGSANTNHYTITRKCYRNYKMTTEIIKKQYPIFFKHKKTAVPFYKSNSTLLQNNSALLQKQQCPFTKTLPYFKKQYPISFKHKKNSSVLLQKQQCPFVNT